MADQSRESGGIITEEQIAESIERLRATKGDLVIPKREADEMKRRATELTIAVNVDVSDALTGLKALRREADAAVRSLKALREYAIQAAGFRGWIEDERGEPVGFVRENGEILTKW